MPYVQYGGWCSYSIALEPGCSKFRGELTIWSSSVEISRSPILSYVGGFPFIVQGGAPIYIYLSLCLGSTEESFVFVSRWGPLDQSGVRRLESGWFSWAAGCLSAVPSLVSWDGSRHSDGRSGSSPVLPSVPMPLIRSATARPPRIASA